MQPNTLGALVACQARVTNKSSSFGFPAFVEVCLVPLKVSVIHVRLSVGAALEIEDDAWGLAISAIKRYHSISIVAVSKVWLPPKVGKPELKSCPALFDISSYEQVWPFSQKTFKNHMGHLTSTRESGETIKRISSENQMLVIPLWWAPWPVRSGGSKNHTPVVRASQSMLRERHICMSCNTCMHIGGVKIGTLGGVYT